MSVGRVGLEPTTVGLKGPLLCRLSYRPAGNVASLVFEDTRPVSDERPLPPALWRLPVGSPIFCRRNHGPPRARPRPAAGDQGRTSGGRPFRDRRAQFIRQMEATISRTPPRRQEAEHLRIAIVVADLLKVNTEELTETARVLGMRARASGLLKLGPRGVCITKGADGAGIHHRDDRS